MKYVFLRYPGGKPKAVTFSYDDGVITDIRLAETLTAHGIKGTFNLNGSVGEDPGHTNVAQIQETILDKGHEIAVHGLTHLAPGRARPIAGIQDVLNGRLFLEEKFGRIIRGMAYPDVGITSFFTGVTYDEVRSYLTQLDIVYSRSVGADNDRFDLPSDWLNWIPTAHHENKHLFDWIDKFNMPYDQVYGYIASRVPKLFYLWGHSYEFEHNKNWDRLEAICERLGGQDEVWYATNMEIYDYVTAYNSLIYSADGNTVYNPTRLDVWMEGDRKIITVPAGQTVRF